MTPFQTFVFNLLYLSRTFLSQLQLKPVNLVKLFNTTNTKSTFWNVFIFQGSSTPSSEATTQKVTDLQGQVRALKNELVTLKDQLSKLRQESSKHQTRADQAEKDAAESAKALKSSLEETEKLTTTLKQVFFSYVHG